MNLLEDIWTDIIAMEQKTNGLLEEMEGYKREYEWGILTLHGS
jgi:hypothetical protein